MRVEALRWLVLPLLLAGTVVLAEPLPEVVLVEATDLQPLGRLAAERGVPILLMFSAEHCPYCGQVKEDFLKPMLRNRDYDQRVLIRRLELDRGGRIRDFDGHELGRDDLATRYRVSVTPTLVYLDHRGRELAEKMVGLTTPDYYGGYIDMAIETAAAKLVSRRP